MKKLMLSVVFAIGYGGAACGQVCTWPTEKTAFEVVGLQNALMVAALSCKTSDSYNAFVTKFQAALAGSREVVDRYFVRAGGLSGRMQEDGFMTRLANEQSASSLAQGAAFCGASGDEFHDVLKLPDAGTLMAFAAAVRVPGQMDVAVCTGTPPDVAARTVIASAGPPAKAKVAGVMVASADKDDGVAKPVSGGTHAKRKAVAKKPARPEVMLVQI